MTEFKSDSSVKRVMNNGVYTALRFGIFTISGFVLIPFLVSEFGNGTYGLIALAGVLTQFVGFISGCISSSIGRFLNIALNKNDWEQSNQIFSTAIVANLALILLQLPVFVLGVWKLHWLIDFPPDESRDFRILVSCNILVYLITVLFSVLRTPISAANRLDISIKIEVACQLLKLALTFGLISWIGPNLWIIAAVNLGIAITGVVATFSVFRTFAGSIVFRTKYVTRKWVRPVMNMAVWSIVAELGQILFQRTDVWIVNRFVDMGLAGVCAALLVWPNFVQQIAKNVSSLLMPVVMIDYANDRIERIQDSLMLFSRLLSILAIFICGFIMLFGGWLLEQWMGEEFRQYHIYLILMLLHFPLTLAREAFWGIFPAFNKMHYLGISNLIGGVMNISLSILAVYLGFGLSGVIIATGISLILQRTFFMSYYAIKLLNVHWYRLAKCYLPGLLIMVLFLIQWIGFENRYLLHVGVSSIVIALLFSFDVFVMERDSKATLKSIFTALVRK
ncbi:lipopolysaccharide biosynthesis protein [Pontiellaceae bacterium B12227]|nr:lipopolysaccharide biosynthesis protein [Pontiellaceae bacterium B12227]